MKSYGVTIHVNSLCKYIVIVLIAFQHFIKQNLTWANFEEKVLKLFCVLTHLLPVSDRLISKLEAL